MTTHPIYDIIIMPFQGLKASAAAELIREEKGMEQYRAPISIRPYRVIFDGFRASYADFYEHPEKYDEEPFRIFGNLYYVGDKKVCRHLIDTGDGLLMFDVGYGNNLPSIEASIRKLGFDPKDIKCIIISHGHFDHFGGANELREKYGCRIFMSRVDADLIEERPDRALVFLGPDPDGKICLPDEKIDDGDVITLGNVRIRCVAAPGHTMGTMAFFFDATDGKTTHSVGYFGGVGFFTVHKEHSRDFGLPENKCELLKETIERLLKESPEIMIGNHPHNNGTIQKAEYMREHPGSNPFIDKDAWPTFLKDLEIKRRQFEELGY